MNSVKFIILICALLSITVYGYSSRIDRNPRYGKVFYKLGMQCQNECSPKKRLRYFQKAVYHDPDLIDAYYQIGIIYGKEGDHEKEVEYYKKITQLDHMHHNAYFKVALDYFQKGELDYAVRYLMQAGQGGHNSSEIYIYTAKVYESKGIYDEAVHFYTTYMSMRGGIVNESFFLAEACKRVWQISKIPGQLDMVLNKIEKLLQIGTLEQEILWKKVDEYIRTDKIPDFIHDRKNAETHTN